MLNLKSVKIAARRSPYALGITLLLVTSLLMWTQRATAAQVTLRKLTLGSSAPSASTTHRYDFTTGSTHSIGSIRFQYCTDASCTTPLADSADVDGVSLTAQSGATGFSVDATGTDSNDIVITRTAASVSSGTALSYTFSSAVNRATTNSTWFVKITTYTGTDGSTGPTDTGVVAASTAEQITVTASVGETLTFCVGTSGITTTSCSGATGSTVDLGTLSASTTGTGVSQFGVGTNAQNGYAVTINGSTLTSGSDTITAMTGATNTSTQGTEEFGVNLRDNATPNVGVEPDGAGDATPADPYDDVDEFFFQTGDTIASDAEEDAFRRFHVAYIANIATDTEPGTYQTVLTYIATATF